MVKLIVFDLDGTLIDSRRDLAGAVNYVRSSMGLEPLDVERVVGFIGNGVNMLVRRSVADAEVDFDEALSRMKKHYAAHLVECTGLYPGVKSGLKELRENGIKLAVVSNKSTDACKSILEKLGVSPYLDDVIGGDSEYPLKPEPDALVALMNKYGFSRDECWILGDHYTDLEAGRRAGFRRVRAAYGFGEARDEQPEFEIGSFGEFVAAIRKF